MCHYVGSGEHSNFRWRQLDDVTNLTFSLTVKNIIQYTYIRFCKVGSVGAVIGIVWCGIVLLPMTAIVCNKYFAIIIPVIGEGP